MTKLRRLIIRDVGLMQDEVIQSTFRDRHAGRRFLRNAFRHANAKQIEVEIHYDDRRLRVRVRDDGKGIDSEVLSGDGRKGRYGLSGMRERAQLIGGQLTVWSKMDFGTELELSVPAERAYTKRPWLAEKFLARLSRRDTVEKP